MTQPEHVPIMNTDRVRPVQNLPVPDSWVPDRPGELAELVPPVGRRVGHNGPDVGYGLKLVKRFSGRLELATGEEEADALAGCFAVGSRRASMFGRAPVIYDFEMSLRLFGFLGEAPEGLVSWRRRLFAGASHHYWEQRAIVDSVPETTLRLTPTQVSARMGDWKTLLQTAE